MKHNDNVNDTHRERRAFENHPHKLSSHSLRVYNITVCLQGFYFINIWCTVHGTFRLFFFYWKGGLTQHWCFIQMLFTILWLDSAVRISKKHLVFLEFDKFEKMTVYCAQCFLKKSTCPFYYIQMSKKRYWCPIWFEMGKSSPCFCGLLARNTSAEQLPILAPCISINFCCYGICFSNVIVIVSLCVHSCCFQSNCTALCSRHVYDKEQCRDYWSFSSVFFLCLSLLTSK